MTNQKHALSRASRMEKLLKARFAPLALILTDQSSQHGGHAGARPEGHFHLEMISAAFAGLNRVARQRLVYQALDEEFAAGLHALSLALKAPGEG